MAEVSLLCDTGHSQEDVSQKMQFALGRVCGPMWTVRSRGHPCIRVLAEQGNK